MLGYDEEHWEGGRKTDVSVRPWCELGPAELAAAAVLGYTNEAWEHADDGTAGLQPSVERAPEADALLPSYHAWHWGHQPSQGEARSPRAHGALGQPTVLGNRRELEAERARHAVQLRPGNAPGGPPNAPCRLRHPTRAFAWAAELDPSPAAEGFGARVTGGSGSTHSGGAPSARYTGLHGWDGWAVPVDAGRSFAEVGK